ncbi:Uncharacterised protein [Shigella sonnei]|nr:Uncharacterised protein [Shigella sonnei]
MHFNGLRFFTFVDDTIQQHVERCFTQRIFWLMDCGQRRRKIAGVAHVIITN